MCGQRLRLVQTTSDIWKPFVTLCKPISDIYMENIYDIVQAISNMCRNIYDLVQTISDMYGKHLKHTTHGWTARKLWCIYQDSLAEISVQHESDQR